MKKRRLSLVALILILSLVMSACVSGNNGNNGTGSNGSGGENSTGNTSGGSDNGKTVEIRFPWWGSVARHEKYNQMMDMFEEKNPGIKVIREPGSWDDYWRKIPTQTAGNNAPDVLMYTTVGQMPEYADKGAVLALDDYMADGTIDVSKVPPNIIELGKYKGKTYMITKGLAAISLTTNIGLLKEKGAPLPKEEYATWDEFIAYMKEIKPLLGKNENGREIFPIEDDAKDDLLLESFLRLKGKNMFAEDGSGLGFAKEDLIEWFELWQSMKNEGLVPPAEITAEEGALQWEQDMLATHRVIMSGRPGNHLKTIKNYMEDELTIIRLPGGNGTFGEVLTGAFLGISAQSEHPEAVAKLINTWLNDLEFNQLYMNEHGIVQNTEILKQLEMNPHDEITTKNMQAVIASTKPQSSRLPGVAGIFQQLGKSYEEVNFGVKSAEAAVNDFFAEAERIINK
ncbi:ABC transporter substrate-binding protein [Paenibacillus sp. sgz302251]|uniref:ABC transporter substrate-binding protein n=1 Tax=Paenibacillus sp. sgz302251 TaxID=3414493 RepID=UPI003C7D5A6E